VHREALIGTESQAGQSDVMDWARLVLAALVIVAVGAARVQVDHSVASGWSQVVGNGYGVCRPLQANLHVGDAWFDVFCRVYARGVQLKADIEGYRHNVNCEVDGRKVAYKLMPFGKATRIVTANLGNLNKGRHQIRWYGEGSGVARMRNMTLTGSSGACSFDNPSRSISTVFFTGMDALETLYGNNPFPLVYKNKINHVLKTLGTSFDGKINSDKIANGMFDIMFEHNKFQNQLGDPWGKIAETNMYAESKIKPWPRISLNKVRGLSRSHYRGETMVVEEPCNTLSNFVFFQCAAHLACMDRRSLTDEDTAVLISQLIGMGAGSTWMHVSGTDNGRLGDVLGMQNYFFYAYEVSVRTMLKLTQSELTANEVAQIKHFGTNANGVTAAREMTRVLGNTSMTLKEKLAELKKQKNYSPNYMISIVAWIQFSVSALRGFIPQSVINLALDLAAKLAGAGNVDLKAHRQAVQKALDKVNVCKSVRKEATSQFAQFSVSMIQALIFQESIVPMPTTARKVYVAMINGLSKIGVGVEHKSVIGKAWNVYNGNDKYCNKISHSMWHEYASHGIGHMLELMQIFVAFTVRGNGDNC